MSGEGLLPASGTARHCAERWGVFEFDEGRRAERRDVLAYLARRRANAQTVAQRSPDHADHARAVVRECDIVSEYLAGALHEGDADFWAAAAISATNPEGA